MTGTFIKKPTVAKTLCPRWTIDPQFIGNCSGRATQSSRKQIRHQKRLLKRDIFRSYLQTYSARITHRPLFVPPGGIGRLQSLPGGWGVVADDLDAALVACAVMPAAKAAWLVWVGEVNSR